MIVVETVMAQDVLIARLKNSEDNFVERKLEGAKAAELRATLVAFANSVVPGSTGVLFIGVRNDGSIQGVLNPDKLQKTVRGLCEQVCYPPIAFSVETLIVQGRSLLAVVVPPSNKRLHFTGPAYTRRGSESVAASRELFDELIASRNEKAGAILRMRGAPITVICIQHRLGSTEHISDTQYRTCSKCTVETCDGHVVRVKDLASPRRVAEPLENVVVSYDEERYRPMLVIRGT